MKIAVINGRPKGRDSITNLMVTSFLRGAEQAGAETLPVTLPIMLLSKQWPVSFTTR